MVELSNESVSYEDIDLKVIHRSTIVIKAILAIISNGEVDIYLKVLVDLLCRPETNSGL